MKATSKSEDSLGRPKKEVALKIKGCLKMKTTSAIRKTFLAAMSSSRSDDVTNSVCLSVCVSVCSHFVKFRAFEELEARCL